MVHILKILDKFTYSFEITYLWKYPHILTQMIYDVGISEIFWPESDSKLHEFKTNFMYRIDIQLKTCLMETGAFEATNILKSLKFCKIKNTWVLKTHLYIFRNLTFIHIWNSMYLGNWPALNIRYLMKLHKFELNVYRICVLLKSGFIKNNYILKSHTKWILKLKLCLSKNFKKSRCSEPSHLSLLICQKLEIANFRDLRSIYMYSRNLKLWKYILLKLHTWIYTLEIICTRLHTWKPIIQLWILMTYIFESVTFRTCELWSSVYELYVLKNLYMIHLYNHRYLKPYLHNTDIYSKSTYNGNRVYIYLKPNVYLLDTSSVREFDRY